MAKNQDPDSLWFKANPRKKQRHRMATAADVKMREAFRGKLICVTKIGGTCLTWHICDGQGPLITERGEWSCRRHGCHSRHRNCPPTV